MKRKMFKVTAVLMAIAMMLSLTLVAACNGGYDGVPATSVVITPALVNLRLGDNITQQLTVQVNPAEANQAVTWESTNTDVVTISDTGLVTAVGGPVGQLGSSPVQMITVRAISVSNNAAVGTANIVVMAAHVPTTGITIVQDDFTLGQRFFQQLTTTFAPANATQNSAVWTSNNEEIATVDQNGRVQAVGVGTAIIRATATGYDVYDEVTVTVTYRTTGAIAMYHEFQNMTLDGNYFLENDITFPAGFIFTPIGGGYGGPAAADDFSGAFTGTFDGRGFTVSDILITAVGPDGTHEAYVWQMAIFRRTHGAEIRNVAFDNVSITNIGGDSGALVARAGPNTIMENISLQGALIAYYWNNAPGAAWSRNAAIAGFVHEGTVMRNIVADVGVAGSNSRNIAGVVSENVTMDNIFVVGDRIAGGVAAEGVTTGFDPERNFSNNDMVVDGGNRNAFLMEDIGEVSFAALPNFAWQLNAGALPTLRPQGPPRAMFNVTLPALSEHFTTSQVLQRVEYGNDHVFTLAFNLGFGEDDDFAIAANGTAVPNANIVRTGATALSGGVLTVTLINVTEAVTITVAGTTAFGAEVTGFRTTDRYIVEGESVAFYAEDEYTFTVTLLGSTAAVDDYITVALTGYASATVNSDSRAGNVFTFVLNTEDMDDDVEIGAVSGLGTRLSGRPSLNLLDTADMVASDDWTAISTAQQFLDMTLDGQYFLTQNINFTDVDFVAIAGGNGTTPDAVTGYRFTGTLDGRGFALQNITLAAGASGVFQLGIFRQTGTGAVIRNLAVTNITIANSAGQGGVLVGRVVGNTLIENVYIQGASNGPGGTAAEWNFNAGIVGNVHAAHGIIIRNAVVNVSSTAHMFAGVGGIIYTSAATPEGWRLFENIFVVTDGFTPRPGSGGSEFFLRANAAGNVPAAVQVNLVAFELAYATAQDYSALPEAFWADTEYTVIPDCVCEDEDCLEEGCECEDADCEDAYCECEVKEEDDEEEED